MLFRIKCTVSYDGTNYYGFQVQGNLPTVESELTKTISRISNEEVKIYASGRTDKGVHAKGQVFHFDTTLDIPEYNWQKAINTYLPKDIRIKKVEKVNESFHARFSAIKKEYRYYILQGEENVFYQNYTAFYPLLDIKKMEEAISLFIGEHNFEGFCSAEVDKRKSFIKTIYDAKIEKKENLIEFIFIGSGFLKYQVRRMMGLLIDIGLNKDTKETILNVFKTKDPRVSHKVAPGNGLYLYKVIYEDEE